jgi:hypothetical protein
LPAFFINGRHNKILHFKAKAESSPEAKTAFSAKLSELNITEVKRVFNKHEIKSGKKYTRHLPIPKRFGTIISIKKGVSELLDSAWIRSL